jgi:hypothetical protein
VNQTFEYRFPYVMTAVALLCILFWVGFMTVGYLGDEYGSPPWDQAGAYAAQGSPRT